MEMSELTDLEAIVSFGDSARYFDEKRHTPKPCGHPLQDGLIGMLHSSYSAHFRMEEAAMVRAPHQPLHHRFATDCPVSYTHLTLPTILRV